MGNVAIRAEGVGKRYRIGARREKYQTLRGAIVNAAKAPIRRLKSTLSGQPPSADEMIWALQDVSFEVQHGEAIGIIGRNGAGKSTLLKILSQITKPTTGSIDIYGRVGSLLEVGTGFHSELTGRENIFLNGAILGMTRHEISRKFDEIVAFAEVEKFIDTPAKHYSSGMYMRLAFAVAAHLEPEILIVDEVLAVGDSRFQEKCLGKMSDVAYAGRTVMFVSHNMPAIQRLCKSGIVLENGRIKTIGPVNDAIASYTETVSQAIQATELKYRRDRQGDQTLHFTAVTILDADENKPIERVLSGENVKFQFHYESIYARDASAVEIAFNVYSPQGIVLTNLNARSVGRSIMPLARSGYFECTWPKFNLRAGIYTCTLFCEVSGSIVDWIQAAFQIHVEDGDFFGTGLLIDRSQGDMLVSYDWTAHVALDERAVS